MIIYAALMFAVALLFGCVALMIYRGNTKLIHDYHQSNVKDQKAYGRAFGKAMGVIALSMFFSGLISLLGASDRIALIAVAIMVIGLMGGIIALIKVQKNYNGGLF